MPSSDPYINNPASSMSQARRWAAVTPSDTVDFAVLPKAIRCNGAGNLSLVGSDGVAVAFAVAAGEILPVQPARINATGTTATGIVALY